jgi:predicted kinase
MNGYIAIHPLTARLSLKQERYAVVDAYVSCHLDVHLCRCEATPATLTGRMRKREAR